MVSNRLKPPPYGSTLKSCWLPRLLYAFIFSYVMVSRDIALALRCYKCTGSTSFFQGCMVPFKEYLLECPSGTVGCYVNYTPPGRGTEAVERGCGHLFGITLRGGAGCESQPQVAQYPPFAETTVCNCDGDGCNVNSINAALNAINVTQLANLNELYISSQGESPTGQVIDKRPDNITYIGVNPSDVPPRLEQAAREGRRETSSDADVQLLDEFRNADQSSGTNGNAESSTLSTSRGRASDTAVHYERQRSSNNGAGASRHAPAETSVLLLLTITGLIRGCLLK